MMTYKCLINIVFIGLLLITVSCDNHQGNTIVEGTADPAVNKAKNTADKTSLRVNISGVDEHTRKELRLSQEKSLIISSGYRPDDDYFRLLAESVGEDLVADDEVDNDDSQVHVLTMHVVVDPSVVSSSLTEEMIRNSANGDLNQVGVGEEDIVSFNSGMVTATVIDTDWKRAQRGVHTNLWP